MNKIFLNNKAQIGDAMAWTIALILIFFIMLFFVGNLTLLNLQVTKDKVGFGTLTDYKSSVNLEGSSIIIKFLKENEDTIFNWADNGKVVKGSNIPGITISKEGVGSVGKINEEEFNHYKNIFDAYVSFIELYGFEKPVFYIRTQDKDLNIEQRESDSEFYGVATPRESDFEYNFQPLNEPAYINRFLITSDEGRLILFVFYDEKSEREYYGFD